ncbi:MAG: DUF971 domain-containing protein [Candidatus Eisenbacteria bacterium]
MTEGHTPRRAPTKMEKTGRDTLRITWDDGMTSEFNVATLRRACPCASCVDEWSGERTLDPFTVLDTVRPMSIEPVGRYAIKITWTDGHDTGIYTFEYLRSLAEGGPAKGR